MTYNLATTGYNDYFYNQYLNGNNANISSNNAKKADNTAEYLLGGSGTFGSTLGTQAAKTKKSTSKDDGKIGFFKAAGNVLKGAGNFFKGLVCDEDGKFSIKQTLKTAAVAAAIGAVTVLTAGTAVPALIAAAGIGIAGVGAAKSVYDIAVAKTDEEDAAAWQSFGSNMTAGLLALFGAKAVSKSSAAGSTAEEFNGAAGLLKSGKSVFKTSKDAIDKSLTGYKNAYKNGDGIKSKYTNIKEEAVKQKNDLAKEVKNNYDNIVYGTKNKIDGKKASIDKKLAEKNKTLKGMKESSKEYGKTKAEINDLNAQKNAINNINQKTSFESANEAIRQDEVKLAELQAQLEKSAANQSKKSELKSQVQKLSKQIEYEKQILNNRVSEAKALKSEIEIREKKLEKLNKDPEKNQSKIASLKKEIELYKSKQDFSLPSAKIKTTKEIDERVNTAKKKADDLDKEVQTAKVENKSQEIINRLKNKAAAAKKEYKEALADQQSAVRQIASENASGSYHKVSSIGSEAVKNPAAKWFTLNAAGRQVETKESSSSSAKDLYPYLYMQLSADEKEYFNTLSDSEQAALENYYNQMIMAA